MTEEEPGKAAYEWVDYYGESGLDGKKFEIMPLLIIERFLDYFSVDGTMTDDVPKYILEALAARFTAFHSEDSKLKTLDQAFGGKLVRQRQARLAFHWKFEIVFSVMSERKRLRAIPISERGKGTPHEIACEIVAEQFHVSADTVRSVFKESRVRAKPKIG
jgi:hypothetical protein